MTERILFKSIIGLIILLFLLSTLYDVYDFYEDSSLLFTFSFVLIRNTITGLFFYYLHQKHNYVIGYLCLFALILPNITQFIWINYPYNEFIHTPLLHFIITGIPSIIGTAFSIYYIFKLIKNPFSNRCMKFTSQLLGYVFLTTLILNTITFPVLGSEHPTLTSYLSYLYQIMNYGTIIYFLVISERELKTKH